MSLLYNSVKSFLLDSCCVRAEFEARLPGPPATTTGIAATLGTGGAVAITGTRSGFLELTDELLAQTKPFRSGLPYQPRTPFLRGIAFFGYQ